jgi:hypothetical protein
MLPSANLKQCYLFGGYIVKYYFIYVTVIAETGKSRVRIFLYIERPEAMRTMAKRLRRGLKAIADWCKQHQHGPVNAQQIALNAKLRGHYQYYGRSTNYRSLGQFYQRVTPYLA